ncbi:MAG: diaminopimelate decarboxylase [Gammaproteobacteria bacterium RIFCSPHIGHO2_12_FULL_42_13]|nr:MAG: diaminopimelate decarboxylase [Gammaproteobacteria bacterium RIFCSPHIGHO2_12_FULL_42_13]
MSCLHYKSDVLFIENCALSTVAEKFGTPCYVYSKAALLHQWQAFDRALQKIPHRICYAVKANSNLAVLNLLAKQHSSFDIVSIGELKRVLAAGGNPANIIFSGVGKRAEEIEFAISTHIHCFNVESEAELQRIIGIAKQLKQTVKIALRVNPDIDPKTHSYIATGLLENKFGIELANIIPLCEQIKNEPSIRLIGIACHIGSQITQLAPFREAIDRMLKLYKEITALGFDLQQLNVGGGLGIQYHDEHPPSILAYTAMLQEKLTSFTGEIMIEPGRAIVGHAGVLLMRVEYLKHTQQKQFAIVDAGMNDLMRPALYSAWQNILPVTKRDQAAIRYDVAGPLCESADFLGKDRELAILAGDLLVVEAAGAYGSSMSSNYNSRPRAAEVLIDDDKLYLIRTRERTEDLYALEKMV